MIARLLIALLRGYKKYISPHLGHHCRFIPTCSEYAMQALAVTVVYGKRTPEHATSHRGSRTTTYILAGKGAPKADFSQGEKADHWYNITRLEVLGNTPHEVIAVLGNSITDGRGSTKNLQNRWTDFFSDALNGIGICCES